MNTFTENIDKPSAIVLDPKKKKKSAKNARKRKKTIFLIVMLCIPVLQWLIFWLYVNINSILLAFQTKTGEWTFNNFNSLFHELSTGGTIMVALLNTLKYFATNLVIMVLALFISYFFYRHIKGTRVFRVIFYLPGIISSVALTTVFAEFIAPAGALGNILEWLGVEEVPELLADSRYATKTIIFYCIWTGFGTNVLLFTGAMKRIPISLIESAQLDGCSMLHEFFSIILPLIWPTISTIIILNCTGLFAASGPILLFTQGKWQTTTIGYWIFDMVYNYNNYNMVSAAGLFFTCIGVPLTLLIRWLIDKIPTAEY